MQVDHRRGKTRMAQQAADRENIDSRFQKSGRVGVAAGVFILLYLVEITLFVRELLLVWILFSELTAFTNGPHVVLNRIRR